MFKAARLTKIKEVILDRGQVDVNTLSSLLNVSDVTIRSDLEQLEKEQFIYRTHGGAVLNEDFIKQKNFQENLLGLKLEYDKKKEYIGQIAAELVRDEEWIFIGQGTTCYYIARELAKKEGINVLTNNLYAAAIMAQNQKANIIVTGGNLVQSHLYLTGDMFLRTMDNIFISKAFMGVSGVDFKGGYTVSDSSELNVYNKIRDISRELIIVADSSKFDKTSFLSLGPLTMPDSVITNDDIAQTYKEFFFNNGVKIFTSYRIKESSIRSEK